VPADHLQMTSQESLAMVQIRFHIYLHHEQDAILHQPGEIVSVKSCEKIVSATQNHDKELKYSSTFSLI